MSVKSYITSPDFGKIAKVDNELDGQNRLHVDALLDVTNQQPIPITFSAPGGEALPTMLSLYYNQSIGAIVAGQYKRAVTYTIQDGWSGYLIRYTSFQSESANSRIVAEIQMGTLNIITNVYVIGNAYSYPQWSGLVESEVTQAIGGAADIVVTVIYTNELGVSARTGTMNIPKSSIIGTRTNLVLQSGDLGVASIQNMSTAPTSASGAIKMLGFIQLSYHKDQGTNSYETIYAPGAVSFPAGTVIGIEHQGGTVSKQRRFDAMIQLTRVV